MVNISIPNPFKPPTGGSGGGSLGDLGGGGSLGDLGGVVDDVVDSIVGDVEDLTEQITGEAEDLIEEGLAFHFGTDGQIYQNFGIRNLPVIYGTRRVQGIKVYRELVTGTTTTTWQGSNTGTTVNAETWYEIFVLSEGGNQGVGGLDGFWVNDEYVSVTSNSDARKELSQSGGFTVSKTTSNMTISATITRGTRDASSAHFGNNLLSSITGLEWTESDVSGEKNKLQNICAVYITYTITTNPDNKVRRLPEIFFKLNGVKIRQNDDSYDHTENPAWILRDYLTDTVYGCGISDSEIDKTSFNTCAGICDVGDPSRIYGCNIIIDTKNKVIDNIKKILATCNGKLIWTSGKYKMYIPTTTTSVAMSFDDEQIIGGIKVKLENKQNKFNQITSEFSWESDSFKKHSISYPDKNNDTTVYNALLTTQDGGYPLKKRVKFDGVTNSNHARYLAKIYCLQSRYNKLVNIEVTSEALDLGIGDLVQLTHSSLGWTDKQFTVQSINVNNNCNVNLVLKEYASTVFVASTMTMPTLGDDTELPNAFTVVAPTGLTMTESSYSSMGSSGQRIRIQLVWNASTDFYKEAYEISYKKSSDSIWIQSGETISESAFLNDFEKGQFDFRVRARNTNKVYSTWLTITNQNVSGISSAPENVEDFTVSVEAQNAKLSWAEPVASELFTGGRIQIRKLEGSNTNWDTASFLANASGSSTSITLPVFSTDEGYYIAKWIDSEANSSILYRSVGVDPSQISTERLASHQEHVAINSQTSANTGWTGTFDDLELGIEDATEGYFVQFENLGLWDSFTSNMDTWIYVDSRGGHKTEGTYTAPAYDLGAVYNTRISSQKVASTNQVTGTNFIDSWHISPLYEASVDQRALWDGSADAAVISTSVRTTQDDPASGSATWTDFTNYTTGNYKARGFQVKAKLKSNAPTGSTGGTQYKFFEYKTNFDLFERDELGQRSSATPAFTYTNRFKDAPTLVITPTTAASGDYFEVTSATGLGATVTFKDSGGSTVTRNYSYLARGF